MLVVRFTADDLARADQLVRDRLALKRQHGVKNRRIAKRKGDWQIALEGDLAELAAARALGIEGSKAFDVSIKGDGRYGDLTMPSGETISVKYNAVIGGELALRQADPEALNDDYAVLVYPADPADPRLGMCVMGYVSRAQFCARHTIEDYGYGPRAVVALEDLEPIEQLRDKINGQRGKRAA